MLQWNILELIFTGDVVTGVLRGGWRHGETDRINYGKKEQMRERGRRSMCLKNNEENPKAAGVMWQPMKPQSSEKSAQFCCTYNLYQVCTACSQLLTVFFLHAFNTQTFCKLLYNSATQKHLTHTHLFFAGLSSQYSLLPFRPWRRNDPSSLWLPFDPEPLSCPLAREPGKKRKMVTAWPAYVSSFLPPLIQNASLSIKH